MIGIIEAVKLCGDVEFSRKTFSAVDTTAFTLGGRSPPLRECWVVYFTAIYIKSCHGAYSDSANPTIKE